MSNMYWWSLVALSGKSNNALLSCIAQFVENLSEHVLLLGQGLLCRKKKEEFYDTQDHDT